MVIEISLDKVTVSSIPEADGYACYNCISCLESALLYSKSLSLNYRKPESTLCKCVTLSGWHSVLVASKVTSTTTSPKTASLTGNVVEPIDVTLSARLYTTDIAMKSPLFHMLWARP